MKNTEKVKTELTKREAVAAEREACAAVAEKHDFCRTVDKINGDCDCERIAEAIRVRTE